MELSYRVPIGGKVRLGRGCPYDGSDITDPVIADRASAFKHEFGDLVDLLGANRDRALLVIVLAPTAGGKDRLGVWIRRSFGNDTAHVVPFHYRKFSALDKGESFIAPYRAASPPIGSGAYWNRSHYDALLYGLWQKTLTSNQFANYLTEVREFERQLTVLDSVTIVKLWLDITATYQHGRVANRLVDPARRDSVKEPDVVEHLDLANYLKAAAVTIGCSNWEFAPWTIIPSDNKLIQEAACFEALCESLRPYRAEWQSKRIQKGNSNVASIRSRIGLESVQHFDSRCTLQDLSVVFDPSSVVAQPWTRSAGDSCQVAI